MGRTKCEHGRERSRCKDCGGSGICEHGRKDCRRASSQFHRRRRQTRRLRRAVAVRPEEPGLTPAPTLLRRRHLLLHGHRAASPGAASLGAATRGAAMRGAACAACAPRCLCRDACAATPSVAARAARGGWRVRCEKGVRAAHTRQPNADGEGGVGGRGEGRARWWGPW